MVAAYDACAHNILEPVFIGERKSIEKHADDLNWDISAYQLIEARNEQDSATKAALLGRNQQVAAIMKGHLHTDTFMKALVSTKTGIKTSKRLFHLFHISDPINQKPFIIGDAAVNISPNFATRQEILRGIDKLARKVGITRPKIAILSATETPIDTMPSSIAAQKLTQWAKVAIPNSDVSGPLAFDLIISQTAAKIKSMEKDPVAGRADAVLVPNIVAGNLLFKALVYLAGGCAGGIVLGGKVPILLTSRADPPAARLASCALASIITNQN